MGEWISVKDRLPEQEARYKGRRAIVCNVVVKPIAPRKNPMVQRSTRYICGYNRVTGEAVWTWGGKYKDRITHWAHDDLKIEV